MNDYFLQLLFNLPLDDSFTYLPPLDEAQEEPPSLEAFAARWRGRRVIAPFGRRSVTGFVVDVSDHPPKGDFTIRRVTRCIDDEPLFGDQELELASWMASMYLASTGEALAAMLPGGRRESSVPSFSVEEEIAAIKPHSLSSQQSSALEAILGNDQRAKYLYGVTGSGKTEVFLRAAEATIAAGKGVIYLVPEISLTHQLVDAIRGRFTDQVALLHSALTPSQRLAEWKKLRGGQALLAVGARSAVFAPIKKLGMIIIDEEHEASYKSGTSPRYHARQVAMRRAALSGARLVMGSATPSVEAYAFMEEGSIQRLSLTERIAGGVLPSVEVVDMRGKNGTLSDELIARMRSAKEAGRQSILFLNRRGFSYFFHCRSCGYQMTCKRCSVALTFHKSSGRMVCHYCGWSRPPLEVCPECGSLDVGYSGFGTEKIEEDVRNHFPDFRLERADTDAVKKKGSLKRILDHFKKGQTDVLLGTQMVAKGLNFPGVSLVGIVQADSSLHLPDFRSRERTFALITQVAGRAGRYDSDGRVVIQTFTPEDPAIALASEGRVEEFYRQELESRRALGFPPASRLLRLVFRSRDAKEAEAACERAASFLRSQLPRGSEILGPAECPIAIIAKNYRFQLILRARKLSMLLPAVTGYRRQKRGKGLYVEYDVDPVSLL
ncbi:replication restart helicase PriA [Sediminispirochaeta smaragdinae]|uniref:Replication restart protein PriA n=1 Tax=Sediminispirochaeta smaragdinae (strain DSM 11293 / JCM 15392 / SEBR 4228) TaxID=573413 RepID=E1R615_SEDSS|nr:primosomal protein N' [Sediminispirochaeta smaragdinae]ADK80780.1 primosomal protein N' [Sediminispirochaeta smaragdinae DSM 11293]